MDKIKKTFIKNLKDWVDTQYQGTITALAETLGTSQGYLSNILRYEHCKDETWRRMVAHHIGMDYDAMIGIEKPDAEVIIHIDSKLDKDHFDVTQKFINKELAIEINQMMVRIEKYDADEFEEIKDTVRSKLKKCEKKYNKGAPDKDSGEETGRTG